MIDRQRPHLATWLFALWAVTALAAVLAGLFGAPRGEPSLGLALQLAGVVALAFLLALRWPALRRSVERLDPALLTSFQSWRILGMMFLFLMALGQLPPVFALPAGIGDVWVGIAAPVVADRMRKGTLSRRGFAWFTAFGLVDFVVAFAAGNWVNIHPESYPGVASMTQLPLALVPGLLVPAFALLHLAAWLSFRKRHAARAGGHTAEAPVPSVAR